MSSPTTTSLPPSANPSDILSPSTDPSDADDDEPSAAQYYNYFFLLLALAFLVLFLLFFYLRRRRKLKSLRLQQHGRAALVRDVERFSSSSSSSSPPPPLPAAAGFWTWRPLSEPSSRLGRSRSAGDDSVLEAGLDERGEAPPPYKTAAAAAAGGGGGGGDKPPPPVLRGETARSTEGETWPMHQLPVGERAGAGPRLPPGYRESVTSEGERLDMPARPATVVTVAERLSEADLEERSQQDLPRPRVQPWNAGRWGSTRRLMSSTDGSA